MAVTTSIRLWLNRLLAPLNLTIGTRAAEKAKQAWLESLIGRGQFERPVLPLLAQFEACDPTPILQDLELHADALRTFSRPPGDHYGYHNDYFTSPDAEVAYVLARRLRPKTILEIGSGNSTFLFRAAIEHGGLATQLISVDPTPRRAVEAAASRVVKGRCEDLPLAEFDALSENDFLFIDSSHEVKAGNDVVRLMLEVLPRLRKGVVVHIHDILLPYDYPMDWTRDYGWNEQYLVQAVLQGSTDFEVLWPGYHLQRAMPGFADHFPALCEGQARSLWLRKAR
jgi:hypothetical protein